MTTTQAQKQQQRMYNIATAATAVSVRRPPPNGAVSGLLVFPIDSGHLGALYGCEAEETALAE